MFFRPSPFQTLQTRCPVTWTKTHLATCSRALRIRGTLFCRCIFSCVMCQSRPLPKKGFARSYGLYALTKRIAGEEQALQRPFRVICRAREGRLCGRRRARQICVRSSRGRQVARQELGKFRQSSRTVRQASRRMGITSSRAMPVCGGQTCLRVSINLLCPLGACPCSTWGTEQPSGRTVEPEPVTRPCAQADSGGPIPRGRRAARVRPSLDLDRSSLPGARTACAWVSTTHGQTDRRATRPSKLSSSHRAQTI